MAGMPEVRTGEGRCGPVTFIDGDEEGGLYNL